MVKNTPKHVAIIMDGNRRWAKSKGMPEVSGHSAGTRALEKIVEAAVKLKIETITVYALSTENIHERAKNEIENLFQLVRSEFRETLPRMMKKGVKPEVIGELSDLPIFVRKIIEETNKKIVKNQKIKLNLAFNYGGKREIILAIKRLFKDGLEIEEINEKSFQDRLYTAGQIDPELVIRTGGKNRLSNFLLWQTSYSEIYFTDKLWPDFDEKDLGDAIDWFSLQKRNFGK